MAVMIGDILTQPAPQRLDRHQVRAVAGQRQQMDAQAPGGGPDRLGAMIRRAVPEYDQLAGGDLGAQPPQHVDGVIAVGPLIRRGFHYYLWLYNFVGNGAAASPI